MPCSRDTLKKDLQKKEEISIFMSVKSSKIVMNRRSLTDLLWMLICYGMTQKIVVGLTYTKGKCRYYIPNSNFGSKHKDQKFHIFKLHDWWKLCCILDLFYAVISRKMWNFWQLVFFTWKPYLQFALSFQRYCLRYVKEGNLREVCRKI